MRPDDEGVLINACFDRVHRGSARANDHHLFHGCTLFMSVRKSDLRDKLADAISTCSVRVARGAASRTYAHRSAALRALPSGSPATLRNDRRLHRLPVGGASRTAWESCNDLYGWWPNRAARAQAPADRSVGGMRVRPTAAANRRRAARGARSVQRGCLVPRELQLKGDKTVDQDQKRERCQSDITGTCTGVADGVFMTDLG